MVRSTVNVQRLIPMEKLASSRISVRLTKLAGNGGDVAEIVDDIVLTWQRIDAALSPIIGQTGVAALYKRSAYLSTQSHPWLTGTHEGVRTVVDLAALKSALAQQSNADAAAAGGAVLELFYELLAGLVGPALTEQLLHSVWTNSFSAPRRTQLNEYQSND